MKISWNRESFLVSLVVVMILFALGYYGYNYLVEPMKLSAESSSRIVEEQTSLLTELSSVKAHGFNRGMRAYIEISACLVCLLFLLKLSVLFSSLSVDGVIY